MTNTDQENAAPAAEGGATNLKRLENIEVHQDHDWRLVEAE
jgi:hypothetical protein